MTSVPFLMKIKRISIGHFHVAENERKKKEQESQNTNKMKLTEKEKEIPSCDSELSR